LLTITDGSNVSNKNAGGLWCSFLPVPARFTHCSELLCLTNLEIRLENNFKMQQIDEKNN